MSLRLLSELKRRNVFRMAGLYLAGCWLVVEIAGTLLPMFGVPDWVLRALVLLLALGLVPALVFAWIYELTPEGVKRADEVSLAESITPQTGQRMNRAIIVLLTVAVACLALDKFFLGPGKAMQPSPGVATAAAADPGPPPGDASRAGAAQGKSIAVLPLLNDSGDQEQQYFSDGLSEDLITALSQFEGLKVIGRSSSFAFRDSGKGSHEIGRTLGVSHLLEGSVRRVGDVVRITTTLVNATDGSAVWSQRYDRPYDNLFALQDEITRAVATALQARLLPAARGQGDRPPSGSLEAYELVLRGNYLVRRRTLEDTEAAVAALRRAVELDPGYGHAWARLAIALSQLWGNFIPSREPGGIEQGIATIRAAVARAQALAPDLAASYLAQAKLQTVENSDIATAERALRRALELAPQDAEVMREYAGTLATLGRLDEALDAIRDAIEFDPMLAASRYNEALFLTATGRHREAEASLAKSLELEPDGAMTHAWLAIVMVLDGRPREAIEAAGREPDEFWRTWALAVAHEAAGDRAAADQALAWLVRHHGNDASMQIAEIHGQRGDADQAFRWLDRAIETGDPGVREIHHSPFLRRFSGDPRYKAFLRRVGLPLVG